MRVAAFIFDLDGTLLNTLPDLVTLTNMVLDEYGMPTRTRDEINSFVGAGARVLLTRAAVPETTDETIDAMFTRWKDLYPAYGHRQTKPYPGMTETLCQMKVRGMKLGVLSNKFDAAVGSVIEEYFPGLFDIARGECADIPRKPDPQGLLFMMNKLGVTAADVVYVGDSASDMEVAIAAGACPVGVSWGYRDASELRNAGASYIVDEPKQLLDDIGSDHLH